MTDQIQLDREQEDVVRAPVGARLFVVAGPGSGKTETVNARVQHLLEEEGLAPDSLLIISFSRAAVEALQRRARSSGARHVGWVTTLDALTARILTDAEVDVSGMGFDRRVETLIKALQVDGSIAEAMEDVEHVIVDEVQDVVGVRGALLSALLEQIPATAGFTLLGDPLQGIYDFQLKGSSWTIATLEKRALEKGAERIELKGQYRAATADARKAMVTRDAGSAQQWATSLDAHVTLMPRLRSDEMAPWLTSTKGTVAVLTQTNAQALLIAGSLYEQGVPAELLGAAFQRPIAPWLAKAFDGFDGKMGRADFLASMPDVDETTRGERWLTLRRLTRAKQSSLDVRDIAPRLAAGAAPVSLYSPRTRITISTVHRAKGLEFDRVLVVDPSTWLRDDLDAYTRTLYVALTRPKHRLFTIPAPALSGGWRMNSALDRVEKSPPKKRGLTGIEIRGSDWRASEPPNTDSDPAATAAFLAKLDPEEPPRPVDLVFNAYQSTSHRPVYDALVDDLLIGTTGDEFAEHLLARCGRNDRWPAIASTFVVGAQTVVGPPQPGPVGKNGMWLAPIIVGPALLNWRR